jgi:hypothetical protein
MKFNWGTGILIFLIAFLLAAAFFITFAMRQNVSLVHEDYYERGVDHTTQMELEERSAPYRKAVRASQQNGSLQISLTDSVAIQVDSARIQLYRPSDQKMDLNYPFDPKRGALVIPAERLVAGRYILTMTWYSGGLTYEVGQPVNIH